MIPISICIITKNEEKNIGKCLAPLMPYGFEIIVVDTGSTDRTREIAAAYTGHIYDFKWIDDFSAARNFSLQKASHNYVLVLDSDEFLSDIDLDGLYKGIKENPHSVGMLLRNNQYTSNGIVTNYPDRVERLFHKECYHYEQPIHEQVVNNKSGYAYDRFDIPLVVEHSGYLGTEEELRQKMERNNTLLFKELKTQPDNPYIYFQIAQSYNMVYDYENSYQYYSKAFALNTNPNEPWARMMMPAFINSMRHTGRLQEACALLEPVYHTFADNADFFCAMGRLYLDAGKPLQAMMEFVKAVNCPVAYEEGANTFIPYSNMGCINEMLGNLPAAIDFYKRCGDFPGTKNRLRELGVEN